MTYLARGGGLWGTVALGGGLIVRGTIGLTYGLCLACLRGSVRLTRCLCLGGGAVGLAGRGAVALARGAKGPATVVIERTRTVGASEATRRAKPIAPAATMSVAPAKSPAAAMSSAAAAAVSSTAAAR